MTRGYSPSLVAPLEVLEAGELLDEGELQHTRRSVALLADDDLGHAAVLVGSLVLLFAVDEDHHVCVLLKATTLAQIRKLRPFFRAAFGRARELRERDHGDPQLLRES